MTLSPENLTEIVHAWIREDLHGGAKMSIGFYAPKLIERLNAARSEAKPIVGVEEVARIVAGVMLERFCMDPEVRHEHAIAIAQAILSKLQGGEGNQGFSSSQSQPILSEEDTPGAFPSGVVR